MSVRPPRLRDGPSRRDTLRMAAGAALLPAGLRPARADEPAWRHALSLMGSPKYPAGFERFENVRADAPKAGTLRLGILGTFDNFNVFVQGVKGELEAGAAALLHDTLMAASDEEVATEYALVAEAARYPEDRGSVTYRLDPRARFQDGSPITAADVVFTFEALKATSPTYAFYYHNVVRAEASADREVTFTFSETGNRELPQIVGEMPVLPKAWWAGRAADGTARDPSLTSLEPPLGSGPYRLKSFDAGRFAVFELAPDYWARDVAVNRGRRNIREIRYEYFRDSTVLLEAFKADRFDFRVETSARDWSTGYEFPAKVEGRVIKEEFQIRSSGVMQAFAFNLRRAAFADARVRRAFNLAFDFEDTNRTLFYGLYRRIDSFFFGTELASSGLPEAREREILEGVRDKVPARVFTTPYTNPVNGGGDAVRTNLREALRLLQEAGCALKGRQLLTKAGEPFRVEFLGFDQNAERVVLPYKAALERLGIASDLRIVDAAQYQNRLRSFEFDITSTVWPQTLSPGNEQREFWGSAAADRQGSRNILGIKDAGIDALIECIVFASDRPELIAATRALDRVLLAHDYVVPQWTSPVIFTARWNRYARPAELPQYGGAAFPDVWWWDDGLAAKTGAPR